MAEFQIQIIMNSREYIGDKELPRGGSNKDFFYNEDDAFIAHKNFLLQELSNLLEQSRSNIYSNIAYAKVKMRPKAIAKSHRPTKLLSNKKRSEIIGGTNIGEMLVEMHPGAIEKIGVLIENAENISKDKTSRTRSEVGAIQSISPYSKEDRVPFSIQELKEWRKQESVNNGYYIELFRPLYILESHFQISSEFKNLLLSFKECLETIDNIDYRILNTTGIGGLLYVSIDNKEERDYIKISTQLLDFLSNHPLVKKVTPEPRLSQFSISYYDGTDIEIKAPEDVSNFPIVGVIDNGISDVLADWICHKNDDLPNIYRVEEHGSKVAGLLVYGNALNGSDIVPEKDGCRLADIFIFPSKENQDKLYSGGNDHFFETLSNAVRIAKEKTGVRIFNLSINQINRIKSENWYSYAARKLDEISDELDVLFVISAGNLEYQYKRNEWVTDNPQENIEGILPEHLALPPSESLRNLSVMALDPKNLAPTSYTRVGPVYLAGIKPDLSYVGGSDLFPLYSVSLGGQKVQASGTSMSAPLVAKILASLDKKINGDISLELLKALLVHNSYYPAIIEDAEYNNIRKNLYGFGIPQSSEKILNEDEHSFTFVIADRISSDKKLSMAFPWPESLRDANGKCRGKIKLTLVSRPFIDAGYGDELVRENITAYLRSMDNNGNKKGLLNFEFTEVQEDSILYEENLIKTAYKWNPIKISHAYLTRKNIIGDVYLEIEYLARDGVPSNYDGVPFAAVLTISDPKREGQVNSEMKAQMQAIGIQLSDIQVASRLRGMI